MPRQKGFSGVSNQNGCQITGLLRGSRPRCRYLITSPIITPFGCIRPWGIKPRLLMKKNYAEKRLKKKCPFLLDHNILYPFVYILISKDMPLRVSSSAFMARLIERTAFLVSFIWSSKRIFDLQPRQITTSRKRACLICMLL